MPRVRKHPGLLLRAELEQRGLSAHQLSLALRVPAKHIAGILRGERSVTAETAVRLGRYLGTRAQYWMNLQALHDISVIEAEMGRVIAAEVTAATP